MATSPEPAAPPRPRRPLPRRLARGLLRFIVWLVVGILALLLIVFALLQTEWARDLIRDIAVDALNDTISGQVSVERLAGTLPFSVELHGVRVHDPDGVETLSIEYLTADVHPLALLRQTVHLSEIRIRGPELTLFDASGQIAIARAFEPREPTPSDPDAIPWVIRLEGIELDRGIIESAIGDADVRLERLRMSVDFHLGERGLRWSELRLDAVAAAPLPRHISLRTDGGLEHGALIVDRFELDAFPHRLVLSGRVDLADLTSGTIDITTLEVDLESLPPGLLPPGLGGQLEGSGAITRSADTVDVQLDVVSPYGRLEVQAGLDTSVAPMTWQGAIYVDSFRLDGLGLDLPPGFIGDATITFEGAGSPLAPEDLMLRVSLLERAPNPGGSVFLRLERPDLGVPLQAGDGTPLNLLVTARDLSLTPWLALFGQPDLEASLDRVRLEGQVRLVPDDGVRVIIGGHWQASAGGSLPDIGPIAVTDLAGELDLQWGGRGLPLGHVRIASASAAAGPNRLSDLDLTFEIRPEGARHKVVGRLSAADLAGGPGARAARLTIPFDLTITDFTGLPEGTFGVALGDASFDLHRVRKLDGRFRLRRAPRGLRVAGTFEAAALRSGRDLAAATARGTVDATLGWRGELDGTVAVTLGGVRAGEITVARVTVNGAVEAPRGIGAEPRFRGRWEVARVAMGELTAEGARGDLDVALDASGRPIGRARLVATDVVAGARTIELVELDSQLLSGGRVAYDVRFASDDLEGAMLGVVTLPLDRRTRLAVIVDRLRITHLSGDDSEARDRHDLILVEQVSWVEGGTIEVGSLQVIAPAGGRGHVRVQGTIDPLAASLDLKLHAQEVDLARWLPEYLALAGLDPATLPDVGGELNVTGTLSGPFSALEGRLTAGLAGGRLDDLRGLSSLIAVEVRGGRVVGRFGLAWHEGGRLDARVDLPVVLQLAPFGLVWDRDAELSVILSAGDTSLGATQRFLMGLGAGMQLEGRPVAGRARLDLEIRGQVRAPVIVIDGEAAPLSFGRFAGGRVILKADSRSNRTELSFFVDGPELSGPTPETPRQRVRIVDLAVALPFDAAEVLLASAPGALVRERLRDEPSAVRLFIPPTRLGNTPAQAVLDAAMSEVVASVDVHVEGPLQDIRLHNGRLGLRNLGWLGLDGAVTVDLRIEGGDLMTYLVASARGREALRTTATIPDLRGLLEPGVSPDRVLYDPRFAVLLFTDDMTSARLWDLNQGLGEIATTFMPDARTMLHANVRGSPAGPLARVSGRIRNARSAQGRGEQLDRNLADDVRFNVSVEAERTTVSFRATQDGDFNPAVGLNASFDVGTTRLLAGGLPESREITVDGNLYADDFGLDRVSRAFGAVLGPSRGTLRGQLAMTGNLLEPRLAGSLDAYFEELAIGAIGFHRSELTVMLLVDDNRVTLVPLRLEGTPRAGGESWFELALSANIRRLSGSGIDIEGRVAMEDFPLLDTKEMKARVTSALDIRGTAGQPEIRGRLEVLEATIALALGGRRVRPLGLPRDVVIVAGDPRPTRDADVVTGFRTGAQIDVRVIIPRDKLLIENDLVRIFPWTDDLRAQTVRGELAITGTIHVPRDRLSLYGRDFVLTEDSRVVFSGDMSVDPQLRITALYDISEVDLGALGLEATSDSRIRVAITGNAQDPRLELTSEPSMDEGNIVSIIVIGAPAGPGEAEENALRNQVANMVVGLATGTFTRFLTDQLPIDTFQLDARGGDLTQGRLTVGKRLARNLFFRYRRNLGARENLDSANEFAAEYRVGPVTLLGEYGDIGRFSLEASLRFRKEVAQPSR